MLLRRGIRDVGIIKEPTNDISQTFCLYGFIGSIVLKLKEYKPEVKNKEKKLCFKVDKIYRRN